MALVLAWAVMTVPYAWVLICDSRDVPVVVTVGVVNQNRTTFMSKATTA